MKQRLASSLVLMLILALLVCTGCGPQATPTPAPTAVPKEAAPAADAGPEIGETYKIGFVAAITGGAAFLGVPERDAAAMLQEQYDAKGGIMGADGKMHPIEIIIHDTEGSGDVAIPVIKKLIDDEGVLAIIGATRSAVAMAMIPVIQEAEIANLSMASSSSIVEPVAERYWIFKVAQSNAHTAPWQVRYAKAIGKSKIANIYVNNAYGEDGAQAIRTSVEAEGLTIVLEETFADSDTDMTAQLTKIRTSGADAVLVTGLPPAAAVFTKQYREMGLDMPLIHNSGVAMKPFIDASGAENAEGVVFPMGKLVATDALPDSDPQKAVLQQFVSDYTAYTGNPPSSFAGHAWDCVELIVGVLAEMPAGLSLAEQRAFVRDGIESTSGFVGVDGVFNFSAEDHVGLSSDDVVLAKITNGDWVYFPESEW